jgi:S-adenosylmethionine hydrolase
LADSIVTLTTDFGTDSPYVAAIKGVILGINPQVRLLDLSHQIPPQNLRHAALFLKDSIPCFPRGIIHVVVVDPGVGSDRALLYADTGGHQLLVPDNGCWTPLSGLFPTPQVRQLAERGYWRPSVSSTFHGRDILAPVAAWLSRGLNPELLGPSAMDWVRLELPAFESSPDCLRGEVLFVDHFGNLITNIPGEVVRPFMARPFRIMVGPNEVTRFVRAYADVAPSEMAALLSSEGMLEIAVNQGSAAERLQTGSGTVVVVTAGS